MSDSDPWQSRWIVVGIVLGGVAVAMTILLFGSWETLVLSAGSNVELDLALRARALQP